MQNVHQLLIHKNFTRPAILKYIIRNNETKGYYIWYIFLFHCAYRKKYLTILKRVDFENFLARYISSHLSQHSQQWVCLILGGVLLIATTDESTEYIPTKYKRPQDNRHATLSWILWRCSSTVGKTRSSKVGKRGSFAFTNQWCYDTQWEKQKGVHDAIYRGKFFSMFCITDRSVLMLWLLHNSIIRLLVVVW